jgi:hypothetical protein
LLVQLVHIVKNLVRPAKLAVGYLLEELKNDITRETPASFEPSNDYVVTKIPRFAFEALAHDNYGVPPGLRSFSQSARGI